MNAQTKSTFEFCESFFCKFNRKTKALNSLVFLFLLNTSSAQIFENFKKIDLKVGASLSANLYIGQDENNFSISLGLGFWKQFNSILLSNQLSLNYYYGGVGNSMLGNPKLPFTRFTYSNLDFIISPSLTAGLGKLHHPTYVRPFNYMSALNAYHEYATSITLMSNFVINNHHRNQRVGGININLGSFSAGYYNDVMDMIFDYSGLGLGDNHDRYWTGGGFANYRVSGINSDFYYEFDRFTGFGGPLFYVSKLLRLNQVFYPFHLGLIDDDSVPVEKVYRKNEAFYNRGKVSFGIRYYDSKYLSNYTINYTKLGDVWYDVQNMIHKSRINPFHPSLSIDLGQVGIGISGFIKN